MGTVSGVVGHQSKSCDIAASCAAHLSGYLQQQQQQQQIISSLTSKGGGAAVVKGEQQER